MDNWDAKIVRSSSKTVGIQITREGKVVIRAPRHMPAADISRLLREKHSWIEKHLAMVSSQNAAGESAPLDVQAIHALADQALADLPPRVHRFAARMGVTYGRITIRNQKGQWGSCSTEGNLNFNCLLMLAPENVRDYLVVHELAHRKQMNHSAAFWAEVAAVLPDYKEQEKWLKTNGGTLLARMRSGTQAEKT